MKNHTIFMLLLIAILCCVFSTVGAKNFNPDADAVFGCGMDPSDYNGKEFDDLYVLLKGCKNFLSTIVPEDNVFVTLKDIKVNGTLYYVDDSYNAATGVYAESSIWGSETNADHYLNIAGDSYIENLYMECMNPHDCNLGLQYPTVINNLGIVPTNSASRGAIRVRGYIDPLVDPKTDYYGDADVASFSEFNFNTFDNDFASALLKRYSVFEYEAADVAYNGILDRGSKVSMEEFYSFFVKEYPYDQEVAVSTVYMKRGTVNNLAVYNNYLYGCGETNIDLINLYVRNARVTNGKTIDTTTQVDFTRMWIPVLRSGGFTNIGIASVFSPVKTNVVLESVETLPLYIDYMVVGTEGLTTKITLDSTKVAMLHYLGGHSPYSNLALNFVSPETGSGPLHIPGIGILLAHGGKVSLDADAYYRSYYHIGSFWLFSGREDLRFGTDVNGIAVPSGFLTLPSFDRFFAETNSMTDDEVMKVRDDLFVEYALQYLYEQIGEVNEWTLTLGTTQEGAVRIADALDRYMMPAPEDVKQSYTTKISLGAVSFGDLNVDTTLENAVGSSWFSATCAVHQYGELASGGARITHVTR